MEHAPRAYSLGSPWSCFLLLPWGMASFPSTCPVPASGPAIPSCCPWRESWCRCCTGWDSAILALAWQHPCTFGGDSAGPCLTPTPRYPVHPGVCCNPQGVTCSPWVGQWLWQGKITSPPPGPGSVGTFEILTKMIRPLLWKIPIHNNIHDCINFQGVMDSIKLIYGPFVVWLYLPFQWYSLNTAPTVLRPSWIIVVFSECICFFHAPMPLHIIFTLPTICFSSWSL